jgi:hypothetical protein
MPDADLVKSILALRSPLWEEKVATWRLNVLRFSGSERVYDRLRPFEWEHVSAGTMEGLPERQRQQVAESDYGRDEYQGRKETAIWVDIPGMVTEKFVGTVFQAFPKEEALDLGLLQTADGGRRAALLTENADGVGSDAQQLSEFWREAMASALPTDFVWIFAEAPDDRPATLADEMSGRRPYFVRFSPVDTPYWHESKGALQALVVEMEERTPRLVDGKITDAPARLFYLMTRRGFTGWGPDFEAGGWWIVNEDGEVAVDTAGRERAGTWEKTSGEIPVARLWYARSGSGMTNIGRLAEEYMNQLSALNFDAWTAGSGKVFFAGADPQQWKEIATAAVGGGRYVPIPPKDTASGVANVDVIPVAGFDASAALEKALNRLLGLATQLMLRELTTAPDASGEARRTEFLSGAAPRLASMAANLEDAMTTAHRFLEQRWGFAQPAARIRWTRAFDLRTMLDKVKGIIESMAQAGDVPSTVTAELYVAALREVGLVKERADGEADPVEAAVRGEVTMTARLAMMEREATAVGRYVREAGAALPQAMRYVRDPEASPEMMDRTDMPEENE